MSFSSMPFLWMFLPAALIIYWLCPKSWIRSAWLLIASVVFYIWSDPEYFAVICAAVILNWLIGTKVRGKKWLLALGIIADLVILVIFKYYGLISAVMVRAVGIPFPAAFSQMPVGISFFTFLGISYLYDRYRSGEERKDNILAVALYYLFFPKVTSGPLVKFERFVPEDRDRETSIKRTAYGIRRFIVGLAKKVIIADQLATSVSGLFLLDLETAPSAYLWVAILMYTVQIYFDFSGYSDMAVGLGAMFGYELPENFDHPYGKRSMTEFWRSWHMTLTRWFTEYLYIPLGGNRKGQIRTLINIMIVFAATGIWHGAGLCFIAWGLWHGAFMVIERIGLKKRLETLPPLLDHIYVLAVVIIGWVFFRAGSLTRALRMLIAMFSFQKGSALPIQMFVSTGTWIIFAIGALLTFPVSGRFSRMLSRRSPKAASVLEIAGLCALLIMSILLISSGSYSSFIYFQF